MSSVFIHEMHLYNEEEGGFRISVGHTTSDERFEGCLVLRMF